MVNLSVKQMFTLEKEIKIDTMKGVIQYTGFCLMCVVFVLNLTTVIVLIQQLFMTYRLLTAGPTGFEIAKSYYLNPNIVTMRHMAVKGFFVQPANICHVVWLYGIRSILQGRDRISCR